MHLEYVENTALQTEGIWVFQIAACFYWPRVRSLNARGGNETIQDKVFRQTISHGSAVKLSLLTCQCTKMTGMNTISTSLS